MPLSVDDLAQAFLDRTLPKVEWTHQAHLKVGLWHALRFDRAEALDHLRQRIRAYNEATGGENTDTAGYHETITRFYVEQIARFVDTIDRSRPIDGLAEELVARLGERELPLRYYSRDRLFSIEARRAWVEPDLAPLA